jgi:hypothetical protein
VQSGINQSIEVDNYTSLVATLAATDYGFSFINNYDAVLVYGPYLHSTLWCGS